MNLLPKQFVIDAGYGDLAVGLLVRVVSILKGGDSKPLVFHMFGMLDFVVAVGTGFTFNAILHDPLMANITTFPIMLIPLDGAPVTGALSIMTLDSVAQEIQQSSRSFLKSDRSCGMTVSAAMVSNRCD